MNSDFYVKPVIETRNLNFHYPDGTHALHDINTNIKKVVDSETK